MQFPLLSGLQHRQIGQQQKNGPQPEFLETLPQKGQRRSKIYGPHQFLPQNRKAHPHHRTISLGRHLGLPHPPNREKKESREVN